MAAVLAISSLGLGTTAEARGETSLDRSTSSAPAPRAATPLSCTTDCTIQSVSSGLFVTVDVNATGDRYGVLRARATQPRGRETFTMMGDCSSRAGCWIKANANGKWLLPSVARMPVRAIAAERSGNTKYRTTGDCTSIEGCMIRPTTPGLNLSADLTATGNDYGAVRPTDPFWTAQRFRVLPASTPVPAPVIGCAQACAIQSLTTGAFVSQTDVGGGMLAADARTVGPRQSFSIVGDCGPGAACAVRSDANGRFVSAEISFPGVPYGILRARATWTRGWESFGVVGDCTSPTGCVLQSRANNRFVVTATASGSVLQATSPDIAGADRFRITPTSQLAPTGIASALTYSCAINTGGTVSCWGSPILSGITTSGVLLDQPTPVVGVIGATAIDANAMQACAVGAGGAVSCWGGPEYGNAEGSLTAVPTGVAGATAVAVGNEHVCAIVAGGTVVCWGGATAGQLGVTLPAGQFWSTTPVTVPGVTGAIAIAAGDFHTCALLSGGTVTCWGENVDGELGLAPGTSASGPVVVPGIAGATAISAHDRGACALVAGTPRCWGSGLSAALTVPPEAIIPDDAHPTAFGTTKAVQLTSDDDFVCVVEVGGAVRCTMFLPEIIDTPSAETSRHQNPVPGVSGAVAVSAGLDHVCARSNDRSVRCWGLNDWGQLGPAATVDQEPFVPVVVTLP